MLRKNPGAGLVENGTEVRSRVRLVISSSRMPTRLAMALEFLGGLGGSMEGRWRAVERRDKVRVARGYYAVLLADETLGETGLRLAFLTVCRKLPMKKTGMPVLLVWVT